MIDFCIKTKSGITIATGYKINSEYFCHKDERKGDWVVTDFKSGMQVARDFKTGKACFEYVKNMDLSTVQAINEKRLKDRYQKAVEEIKAWREENL